MLVYNAVMQRSNSRQTNFQPWRQPSTLDHHTNKISRSHDDPFGLARVKGT